MKTTVSYSSCSFYSKGYGPQNCPLCGVTVPDGEAHTCEKKTQTLEAKKAKR